MRPTMFLFIWTSGFRGENFQKSANQKQELPVVAMFVNRSELNEQSLQGTFHRCFLPSFGFIWPSGFRGDYFLELDQSETRITVVAMFVNRQGRLEQILQRTFHRCFLQSFGSFGHAVTEQKIFQKLTNRKQELPVVAMFVNGWGQNKQSLQRTIHRSFLPGFRGEDLKFKS